MIDLETIRTHCFAKKGKITEDFPFDDETLVIRLFQKMFVLVNSDSIPLRVNLKCDPEKAIELRERYDAVKPGYHMNKKMWNTVVIDGRLPDTLILEMIGHSYDEVAKKLPKNLQKKLQ